jgi:hypothetical protein
MHRKKYHILVIIKVVAINGHDLTESRINMRRYLTRTTGTYLLNVGWNLPGKENRSGR